MLIPTNHSSPLSTNTSLAVSYFPSTSSTTHNHPPNSSNMRRSPDPSAPNQWRPTTSTKTIDNGNTRSRRARVGFVVDLRQSRAAASDHASQSGRDPEDGGDHNSDVLTQSGQFDPTSIQSASTPASGCESPTGSIEDPGSSEESTGEDDDEEYDADTTRTNISVPKDLDGDGTGEVVPETPDEDSEEEQQDVEDFGGPNVINVDRDPTGPLPRFPRAQTPISAPHGANTI